MAPNIALQIFEPFFTTKSQKWGTGIGLFLSQQVMQKFSGDLTLEESTDSGALFCLDFPQL